MGFLVPLMAFGQHVLELRIDSLPATHEGEPLYVAGNFNNWQPNDPEMRLTKNGEGGYEITVRYDHIPSDRIEFKFTRGTWQKSESSAEGRLTGPRVSELYKDTLIYSKIAGWRDDFPATTASKNLHVVKERFYMPQLNRYRKIWIYLPEDYESSPKRYSVLYMHDGQHLFDEATSQGRIGPIEWGVDETLDARKDAGIVVAIDHHPDMRIRIPEFYYHKNSEYPEVEGQAYLEFIVKTLKPYIDKHYRTLSGKENTGIIGSSLGGLISLYAGIHYPEVFGFVGAFSPSIWLDEGHLEEEIDQLEKTESIAQQHYFLYSGESENREKPDGSFVRMTEDVNRIADLLKNRANPEIEQLVKPYGRHGALYWREAFPVFYDWFIQKSEENPGKP